MTPERLAGRVSMTLREVHEMTGAPIALIRRLIANGTLRSRRVGRQVFVDPASVHSSRCTVDCAQRPGGRLKFRQHPSQHEHVGYVALSHATQRADHVAAADLERRHCHPHQLPPSDVDVDAVDLAILVQVAALAGVARR